MTTFDGQPPKENPDFRRLRMALEDRGYQLTAGDIYDLCWLVGRLGCVAAPATLIPPRLVSLFDACCQVYDLGERPLHKRRATIEGAALMECPTCDGDGTIPSAAPRGQPLTCPTCDGRGVVPTGETTP